MFAYISTSIERLSRLSGTGAPALSDFRVDEYFAADPRLRHRARSPRRPTARHAGTAALAVLMLDSYE